MSPGWSAAQMAATAAAFENYKKAAQAASSAAYAAGSPRPRRGPRWPRCRASRRFHAGAVGCAVDERVPRCARGVRGQGGGGGGEPAVRVAGAGGQPRDDDGRQPGFAAQRLLLEAQIKNRRGANTGKAVPKAVPNGSEASDMSAHGGTAWAAAMAAMGQQFYAQMLHNPSGLSAILHKG